jgi:glutamine cyclotransferase
MKLYKSFILIALGSIMTSCGDDKPNFKIDTSNLKQFYKSTESISLKVTDDKNTVIDSVVYYLDGKKIASTDSQPFVYELNGEKFGPKSIKGLVFHNGESFEVSVGIEVVSSIEPKLLTYEILNTYPHDMEAYTQGLEFHNGILYESTGQYNRSSVRKTDAKTGKVLQKVDLDGKYFGEGLTILNGKMYQLTWRELTGFVYNPETLEKEKEFKFFKNIEGWGLTNDGKNLYLSDGTETIYIVNPETFEELDHLKVYTANNKIQAVNEMEWVNGKIFANIYTRDAIAIIDPKSGAVEGVLDLSALRKLVTQHAKLDVLNGIAYNPTTKTLFVTGKNWDKMFEIKINE